MTRWRRGASSPQPGMWWWAAYYARPATGEEATAQARQRLSLHLGRGRSGEPKPAGGQGKVCAERQFDQIIVATSPRRVSRWLGADLPRQAQRRFRLPVTAIITSY
jgi:hypothetical protein